MSKAIALLWLGSQATLAAHEADLDAYAHAHLVRFEAPATDAPRRGSTVKAGYDADLVTRIEDLLEQARIASASLDATTATAKGAEVEALLRSNPELPQAAWLMAERWHVAASLRAGAAPSEAEALEERAAALEGARAPAYGSARSSLGRPGEPLAITLDGLRSGDRVYWDGKRVEPRLDTPAGEHHVRVVRRGHVVFADWIAVEPKATSIRLGVPRPRSCSRDDLEGSTITDDRARAADGVRCANWALARPAAQGGVEIASCHGSRCGLLFVWHRRLGAVYEGPPQPPPEPGFPAWATYTLIGVGAAAVTGVILWRSGVFEGPEPGRTRWQFQGPN
jgi:hypothetical protein